MSEAFLIFEINGKDKTIWVVDSTNLSIIESKCEDIPGILDEDGQLTDDLHSIVYWIHTAVKNYQRTHHVKGIDFIVYTNSWVFLNRLGEVIAPLYDQQKRYPNGKKEFLSKYNSEGQFFLELGNSDTSNFNGGFLLYHIKQSKPEILKRATNALLLSHYLSYTFTKRDINTYTTISFHGGLWNFIEKRFHHWLSAEKLSFATHEFYKESYIEQDGLKIGVGSAYKSKILTVLKAIDERFFVLISGNRRNVSINPFNHYKLSSKDIDNEVFLMLDKDGSNMRASRLSAGDEHKRQIRHLSEYFGVTPEYYQTVKFDFKIIQQLRDRFSQVRPQQTGLYMNHDCPFVERNLNAYKTFEQAYHQFMMDLVTQQVQSTSLVFGAKLPKRIYLEGEFSQNYVFMNLLAEAFYQIEVYAITRREVAALGAAIELNPEAEFSAEKIGLIRYFA